MRASNCADKYRAGCPPRGAPLSASTAFGRGGLLPAASFRPAAPSPAPATASSAPAPQSSGADACAVAVSITQSDPETRLRSGAVQSAVAALPCALATPTTAAGSAPAPRLLPIPAAHRQTSDAHNIATAAHAQHDPALRPARPHAQKNRHCAPTPALPQPSPCSVTRAAQTAPAPAALPAPAPAPTPPSQQATYQ